VEGDAQRFAQNVARLPIGITSGQNDARGGGSRLAEESASRTFARHKTSANAEDSVAAKVNRKRSFMPQFAGL